MLHNKLTNQLTNETNERSCLEGKPLKQWWQIEDAFRRAPASKGPLDRYQNVTIRSAILFMLVLPFAMAISYHAAGPQSIKLILLSTLVALVLFIQLVLSYKHHSKIAVEIQLLDRGVRLKAPLLPDRTIDWTEIADFFEIQYGDHLLLTTKGEDFVLSSDLSNSAALFAQIRSRCPQYNEEFTTSIRLPNSFIDGGIAAGLAVGIACLFPFLSLLLYAEGRPIPMDAVAFSLIVVSITVVCWRLQVSKIAELIRIGETRVMVRTRSGTVYQLLRSDIQRVSKFGAFYILSTSKGRFFTIIEKSEPASPKILEFRNSIITDTNRLA